MNQAWDQGQESHYNQRSNFSSALISLSTCGEIFLGKNRLIPARSPNIEWGFNKNVASGEYHYINVRFCVYVSNK